MSTEAKTNTIKKSTVRNVLIVVIFVLSMACATICITTNVSGIMKNNYENDSRVVTGLVANFVDKSFARPITVAETIAKDPATLEILKVNTRQEALDIEKYAASYYKSLRDGFGYTMVFAIDDNTKAYFTPEGLTRFIDPANNPNDAWYTTAVNSGKAYSIDVDVDQAANWTLSTFINTPVYSRDNQLLGVTGIGVNMEELSDLFTRYERMYNIKINLINADGLIQIDTDLERIEIDKVHIDNLNKYADGNVYYEQVDNKGRTITYLESLGWFLVVQNNESITANTLNFWLPGVVCMIVGLALILLVMFFTRSKGDKVSEKGTEPQQADTNESSEQTAAS